jgi:hypothetical protein
LFPRAAFVIEKILLVKIEVEDKHLRDRYSSASARFIINLLCLSAFTRRESQGKIPVKNKTFPLSSLDLDFEARRKKKNREEKITKKKQKSPATDQQFSGFLSL